MVERRLILAVLAAALAGAADARTRGLRMHGRSGMTAYDFAFTSLEEEPLPLGAYRGKPILVVNTASFCGFTPQYTDLETLWNDYRARGLIVLGVPSNDFGEQEPGAGRQIRALCDSFAVSFPMSRREAVIGPSAHPFYRWVAAELGEDFLPRWNFHKYLVDRAGALAGSWQSQVDPVSPEIRRAVEEALAAPPS